MRKVDGTKGSMIGCLKMIPHLSGRNFRTKQPRSCDFVMENFEAREAARKGEIEGLQNTMAQLKTSSALVLVL